MVQFPMKKSKSLLEDSGEAVMMRSPFGANFKGGKGKLSIWAEAEVAIATDNRIVRLRENVILREFMGQSYTFAGLGK